MFSKKCATKLAALFCAVVVTIALSSTQIKAQENQDGAALEAVVHVLKEAIKEAQSNNISGFPPLKKATMDFNTLVHKDAGGKISFLIFSLGTKKETDQASKLSLELQPPPTTGAVASTADSLSKMLAKSINLAKIAVLAANNDPTNSLPKLSTRTVTIEVKFAVSHKNEGGIKIVDLLPVGIEAGGKIDKTKIHTLSLVFGT